MQAEAAYAKQVLADTEVLQEDLYKELRGRIQEADQTVPLRQTHELERNPTALDHCL